MNFKKILAAALALMMLMSAGFTVAVSSAEDELPFTDVAKDWAYEPIKYVYERGLMNGTGGTSFSPKASLTRAMVVTVLYRLAGSPTVYFDEADFLDVKDHQYYSDAAAWGLENSVVTGTSTDDWGVPYFSPDRSITRQELATLFIRFAKYQGVKMDNTGDLNKFTDASQVASWASDAMKWATSVGLINGTGNGTTLSPTGEATREQFAAIIQRYATSEFDYEIFYAEPVTGNSYRKPTYSLCNDADVYVAVDGNDSNPGTLDKPLATLEGAKAKVRELKKTAKDEIVVAFKAGEYEAPDNVTFTAEDGGSEKIPVTYRVYGDGDVIFNGGFTVKGNEFVKIDGDENPYFPSAAKDKIYKADISDRLTADPEYYNYLFSEANGMCWQARDLNKDASGSNKYYYNMTTEGDLRTCIKLEKNLPSTVEKFSSIDGLWIRGQLCTGYTFDIFKVTGYDPETQLLYLDTANYPGLADNYYQPHTTFNGLATESRMPDQVMFYNLPDFLDGDGEYWIDTDTKTLYVYNAYGDYIYSQSGAFMTFEEGADYISLVGLQFRGAATETMITVNSDHFTFDGCRIGNFSCMYAVMSNGINNFTMENCEVYNFPGHGIRLMSDADRNNIISANNVIRNNFFHGFGDPEYWSDAVELCNDVGAIIEHNEFKDACHGGLSFYDSIDTIIQYNIFDHLMHSTTDYGAIYTHRGCAYRDNVIRYNLFKNFTNPNQGYGFYNDGSYGQLYYGNIHYNGGAPGYVCNDGRDNVIDDNIVIKVGSVGSLMGFMSYNPGPYLVLSDPGKQGDIDGLLSHMNKRVKPGEEGYELWYSRWQIMYEYNYDTASAGDFNSFYSTINYVRNNKLFSGSNTNGEKLELSETGEKFAVAEGNEKYNLTTNPYFKSPSSGDYSIVSNTDDFTHHYDFHQIGIIN